MTMKSGRDHPHAIWLAGRIQGGGMALWGRCRCDAKLMDPDAIRRHLREHGGPIANEYLAERYGVALLRTAA